MITLGWDSIPIYLLITLPLTWHILTSDTLEEQKDG